jgi:hypothetical protein
MTAVPEFHRPVAVDRIGAAGLDQRVAASPAECAALAARLGIPAVGSLACAFRLTRAEGGRIAAAAWLEARLVRESVVSLEPFEADHVEDFAVVFVPEAALAEDPDLDAPDEIPYGGGMIDLGEAAAEQLALTLDPYPRRPGEALDLDDDAAPPTSPFAALARRG